MFIYLANIYCAPTMFQALLLNAGNIEIMRQGKERSHDCEETQTINKISHKICIVFDNDQ